VSRKGSKGEFQCESCDEVLEVLMAQPMLPSDLESNPEKPFE
jgi:hypothetical protein